MVKITDNPYDYVEAKAMADKVKVKMTECEQDGFTITVGTTVVTVFDAESPVREAFIAKEIKALLETGQW